MSQKRSQDASPKGETPWLDRVNEAYYDQMGVEFGRTTRDRINWMCAQVCGNTVLDVGCSQGITSILLAREGFDVTGLDISEAAIRYAESECEKEIGCVQSRLRFVCGDLSAVSGKVYDTVILGEVVEHQTNPQRFLRTAAEVVAPAGKMIITVPFGLHPWPDHKSTIFPRHIWHALREGFEFQCLEVINGYIRVVACKVGAIECRKSTPEILLKATEDGALQAQVRYFELSKRNDELRKRLSELGSKLEKALEGASVAGFERAALMRECENRGGEIARLSEIFALVGRQSESIGSHLSGLTERLAEQLAKTDSYVQELSGLRRELAGSYEKVARLDAENSLLREKLKRAEEHSFSWERLLGELRETNSSLDAELHDKEREISILRARVEELSDKLDAALTEKVLAKQEAERERHNGEETRSQLAALRSELAVAQQKRAGHYMHLQAERAYKAELIALINRLHEDNYRYQNSLALAIGRALLSLRSPKGMVRLPLEIGRIWKEHRERVRKGLQIPPVVLPTFKPSQLSDKQTGGSTSSEGSSVLDRYNVPSQAEMGRARKELSILGWKQELEPQKVIVMSVLDEFSRACFSPHASLVEPRPDNWEGLLDTYRPRFLFVESAWKGNQGAWQYRISSYAHPPGDELAKMVEGFHSKGLPTVFWNKEDPVHFNNFIANASKFDVIFTTAAEAIPMYRKVCQARVGVLQFAAEDSLHNPIGSGKRNGKVCFAGSFYANRFKERMDDQLMLLDAASEFDLDIFDRNYQHDSRGRSDFAFPERYDRFVRGRLPYREMGKAYREYSVFLNVNSVIDSPTMFSRRVFELLACGTPVVSTWCRGIEETFGDDIVWQVKSLDEAKDAIRTLLEDEREWKRRSLKGIRAVLSWHTFRHRFIDVCRFIGIDVPTLELDMDVHVLAMVADKEEARFVAEAFRRQEVDGRIRKRLLLFSASELDGIADKDIEVVAGVDSSIVDLVTRLQGGGSRCRAIAVFSPKSVYGKYYLQDLLHALRYSRADVVGKPLLAEQKHARYSFGVRLDPASLVFLEGALDREQISALMSGEHGAGVMHTIRTFAADDANYHRMNGLLSAEAVETVLRRIEV